MAKIGDAFEVNPNELKDFGGEDGPHLRVVITEPDKLGKVVVVNLTSWQPRYEQTCVFKGGEHSWIKHKTVVKYGMTKLWPVAIIDVKLKEGRLISHPPVSSDVLKKIQEGAIKSEFLPTGAIPLIKVFDPRKTVLVQQPPVQRVGAARPAV